MRFGIRSVPTFIYMRNDQEVSRAAGVLSVDDLKEMFWD